MYNGGCHCGSSAPRRRAPAIMVEETYTRTRVYYSEPVRRSISTNSVYDQLDAPARNVSYISSGSILSRPSSSMLVIKPPPRSKSASSYGYEDEPSHRYREDSSASLRPSRTLSPYSSSSSTFLPGLENSSSSHRYHY